MRIFSILLIAMFALLGSELAARPSGQVFGWGFNGNGEATGIPTPDCHPSLSSGKMSRREYYERSHPCTNGFVTIDGQVLTDAVAVAAGNCHGLALKSDSTVVGWGLNTYGEATGIPSPGFASGQVKIDGHLLSNVVAITAGFYDSLALLSDGTIIRWGGLPEHPRPFFAERWSNVVAIAGGYDCGLALKNDGTAGSLHSFFSPMTKVVGLTNIVAIAAPGDMNGDSLALTKDGSVIQWYASNRRPSPVEANNSVSIAVGLGNCLALKDDGTVFGWGKNHYGEATGLPTKAEPYTSSGFVTISGKILSNVIAIAAGGSYSNDGAYREHSLALKRDGTVVAWGHFGRSRPAFVPDGLSNVIAIAAGGGANIDGKGAGFCLAITTNRPATMQSWNSK